MNHFTRIAENIEIRPLYDTVVKHWDLFDRITARQTTPGSPHHHTQSIFLRWCENLTVPAVFTDIPAVDFPALDLLPEARPLIDKVVELVGGKELGRVLIANLLPGGKIDKHIDEGAYADHYERFHLILMSDPGNIFFIEAEPGLSECAHMLPGELWWFNHKEPHYVWNDSTRGRLHMIIDVVAPKWRRERR